MYLHSTCVLTVVVHVYSQSTCVLTQYMCTYGCGACVLTDDMCTYTVHVYLRLWCMCAHRGTCVLTQCM